MKAGISTKSMGDYFKTHFTLARAPGEHVFERSSQYVKSAI